MTQTAYAAEAGLSRQLVAWASLRSPSLMGMVGEAERRERFGYALQRAIAVRRLSARKIAEQLQVDPRKIAAWQTGKKLPDLYETHALVEVLRVSEELFRNPPPVPQLPAYPIERYLLDAVDQGAEEGLANEDPDDEDDAGPDVPQ